MQEGSLRVDGNINLHIDTPDGKVATPIAEVKNMNSFRAVERALAHEAERQLAAWRETAQELGDAPKQTRSWDDAAGVTRPMREKEESSDYRYLPDPDLLPVTTTDEEVAAVRASLGELPAALRARLEATYQIKPYDSDVLVSQGRGLVDYYIALAEACGDGRLAGNWTQQDILRTLKQRGITIEEFPVSAAQAGELLRRVRSGTLDTTRGREVLAQMIEAGQSVDEAMQALGIEAVDESDLVALCRELLAANPQIVADLADGKQKAVGALIGQAKQRNPNVNPAQVREICLKLAAGD
jgi:aspartyl-tRNA(Asn)/glutamyl-tRNA(Gln) amidotransferase subunit B